MTRSTREHGFALASLHQSQRKVSAVDGQHGSGDPASLAGGKENSGLGEVVGGSQLRPRGLGVQRLLGWGSSGKGRIVAVARKPGQTALTLMRCGAKSRASWRVKVTTA